MFSIMSEKPGPLVAVIARAPVHDAPIIEAMDAISSSIWMKVPFFFGSLYGHMLRNFGRRCNRVPSEEIAPGSEGTLSTGYISLHELSFTQYSIATLTVSPGFSSRNRIAWSGHVIRQTPHSTLPVQVPEPAVRTAFRPVEQGDQDPFPVWFCACLEYPVRASSDAEVTALTAGLINLDLHMGVLLSCTSFCILRLFE